MDTLSHIVLQHLGNPLYGKDGHLDEVIKLNPHIPNPDLIYPGETVFVGIPTPNEVVEPEEKTSLESSAEEPSPEEGSTAPEVAIQQKDQEEPSSFLLAAFLEWGYIESSLVDRVNSTLGSAHGVMRSYMTPDFGLDLSYPSHSSFRFFMRPSVQWVNWSRSNEREILFRSQVYPSVKLGMRWDLYSDLMGWMDFGIDRKLFNYARNLTSIENQGVYIPSVGLGFRYLFTESAYFEPKAEYLLSKKYTYYQVKSGYSFSAQIGWELSKSWIFEPYLGFKYEKQNSTILDKALYEGLVGLKAQIF